MQFQLTSIAPRVFASEHRSPLRLLKARLKILLKVLTELLIARLKVLLKVLVRLQKARLKVLLKVPIRPFKRTYKTLLKSSWPGLPRCYIDELLEAL